MRCTKPKLRQKIFSLHHPNSNFHALMRHVGGPELEFSSPVDGIINVIRPYKLISKSQLHWISSQLLRLALKANTTCHRCGNFSIKW